MYLRFKVENLSDGKYTLLGNDLFFKVTDIDVDRMPDDIENVADGTIDFIISKKDAIEIMNTLLDSENLLTKEAEDLIAELAEKIEN